MNIQIGLSPTLGSTLRRACHKIVETIQKLGLSNKTYSLFNKASNVTWLRKGHLLLNPTQTQIKEIQQAYLRKSRIEQWKIVDQRSFFSSEWKKRPRAVIDTLIVGATNSNSWSPKDVYDFDTSKNNDVTLGSPLPGITCHLFINAQSGIIEQCADYEDLTFHTRGCNLRAINITLQHLVTGNTAAPIKKMVEKLEHLLCLLCLEFKLDPYKAIKAQHEIKFKWLPWTKGHSHIDDLAPGHILSMDNLRRNVSIMLKRKLDYAGVFEGQINETFDKDAYKAINKFDSGSIRHLYKKTTIENWN